MTRRMLINGRYAEELRMAIVEDNVLESYKVQMQVGGVERGNIYRGVVANIEPSLDAAFIDYGSEKHGFLACHDVVPQAYHRSADEQGAPRIEQILERGRPLLVQVTRDAVGGKGAVLSTNISLAGRYLVLMPFDDAKGMSRKVEDEEVRKGLKQKVQSLVTDGYGFIVRTNAVDQTKTVLKHDLDQLVRLWERVRGAHADGRSPSLLHNDQDLIVQALRDHLDQAIDEIIIDDERLLTRAEEYLQSAMPKHSITLELYREKIPLFSRHNLEPQVAAVYRRTVPLPGGGSIVIDPTEALTAIDVNSGKSTGANSQEETAFATNVEAAVEVARQLRLRDIGGLVVVDFIDMRSPKQRREVERTIKEAMKRDKARSHVGRISSNGLLEINRQRIQQALGMRAHRLCPSCQGSGRLISTDLHGLHLLRRLEAGAATGRMRRARVALHPALAEVVQNRRRAHLAALEAELKIEVEIIADTGLALGEERIQWTEREGDVATDLAPRSERSEPIAHADTGRGGGRSQPERKSRERRRSRRGRGSGAAAADTVALQPAPPVVTTAVVMAASAPVVAQDLPAAAAPLDAAEPQPSAQRVGRRRRRRGRRNQVSQPSLAADHPPSESAQPAGDTSSVGIAAGAAEERRRRRRRRGGRRRKAQEPLTSGAISVEDQPT